MCIRGFSDKYSWITDYYQSDRPLLWDEEYQPKPALSAVRIALLEGTKGYLRLSNEKDWGKDWLMCTPQAGESNAEDQPVAGVAVDEPSFDTVS